MWRSKGTLLGYAVVVLVAATVAKLMIFSPRVVMTATVARQELVTEEVLGTGVVNARVLPRVGSKITGRIERVLVDEGDQVQAGELTFTLEDADLRHQVARARARLEAARASATQAQKAWERAGTLIATSAVSQEELDVYEEKFRIAESAIRVEEAELAYQEFKLSEAQVTSPVAGVVVRRWVDPGDAVVAGQPVLTVADVDTVVLEANVDQRFAARVAKGQRATIVLRGRASRPLEGRVFRINPQADPVTEELLVEVAFQLPPEELRVGHWGEAFVEVGAVTSALVVPKAAVMPAANERFVFVATPEGTARRVRVELGPTSPRQPIVSVTGELEPGDLVILNPIGVKPGDAVRATPPAAPPSSGPQGPR